MTTKQNHSHTKKPCRFTLIELLIVVSIIGILVAILMPALARTKYMAQLVTCMNNQKQIAMGCLAYAGDNSGRWPKRVGSDASVWGTSNPGNGLPSHFRNNHYDARPQLNAMYPVDELQCPFVPPLEIMSTTTTPILGPYSVFAGWKTSEVAAEQRMSRVSRLMTYKGKEFDILVTCKETTRKDVPYVLGVHPDRTEGMMWLDYSPGNKSFYKNNNLPVRGPIDSAFTRIDGSAFLIKNVQVYDERISRIPYKYDRGTSYALNETVHYTQLPAIDDL